MQHFKLNLLITRRCHPNSEALFSDLDTKYTLSDDIKISVRENEKRWLLTDVENNRTYNIARESDSFNIYQGTVNPELDTGEIEVAVDSLNNLNTAKTPPFPVEDDIEVAEDIRMRYRFVDLRRPEMQKTLKIRHKAALAARNYMNEQGFFEIETPILMNSTPEGARDVLVPSRHYPGRFYALPQSPQQFKQILMMSGVDRYFQIARCFRDEDTRADRQLEFTQLDIEMSFAGVDDVLEITEGPDEADFEKAGGIPVQTPFLRLPYHESMARFGNDKPDTRFGMNSRTCPMLWQTANFRYLPRALSSGGQVKGIAVPGGADFSRKDVDDLTEFVATYRRKGLAWVKVTSDGKPESRYSSALSSFSKQSILKQHRREWVLNPGTSCSLSPTDRKCRGRSRQSSPTSWSQTQHDW